MGRNVEALPLAGIPSDDRAMRDVLKEIGKRLLRLVVPAVGGLVSLKFPEIVANARGNWALTLGGSPPDWFTEKTLSPWVQPGLGALIGFSLVWALWPLASLVVHWIANKFKERHMAVMTVAFGVGVVALGGAVAWRGIADMLPAKPRALSVAVMKGIEAMADVVPSSSYPKGTDVHGIKWERAYSRVDVHVRNRDNRAYDDVDVYITTDRKITDGRATSAINKCQLGPEGAPPEGLVIGEEADGKSVTIPVTAHLKGISFVSTYRLHCDRVAAHSEILVTLATIDMPAGVPNFDTLYDRLPSDPTVTVVRVAYTDAGVRKEYAIPFMSAADVMAVANHTAVPASAPSPRAKAVPTNLPLGVGTLRFQQFSPDIELTGNMGKVTLRAFMINESEKKIRFHIDSMSGSINGTKLQELKPDGYFFVAPHAGTSVFYDVDRAFDLSNGIIEATFQYILSYDSLPASGEIRHTGRTVSIRRVFKIRDDPRLGDREELPGYLKILSEIEN